MTIEYFGVKGNPFESQNYLKLKLGGGIVVSGICKIVIERPGQSHPYLAQSGWQSNYNKEVIEALPSDDGTFELCLPISLAQFLDSEHNYKVELLDISNNSLGVFGMNWMPPPRAVMPAPPSAETEEQRVPEEPAPFVAPPLIDEPEPMSEPFEKEKPVPVSRTVERCVYCGGQIFSTFKICPYCGTPFGVG